MSYADGWAAINLEMPPRVPRTEYSAAKHWKLINAVTGSRVDENSAPEDQIAAGRAFMREWDYCFSWATLIGGTELGEFGTDMGHAEYAAGGVDWRLPKQNPHYRTAEDVLSFDPWEALGPKNHGELVRRFEEHYQHNLAATPDQVNMTGVYVTMVSGFIALFGWDMFLLAVGTDPVRFGELANRYASWIGQYYDAMADADVPVIMVHDDMVWSSGPFLNPAWYREYIFPNMKRLFAPLREAGKIVAFTSDGDFSMFIDDLVDCGVSGFAMEPTTDMGYIAETYGRSHFFIGNADTRILLGGTNAEIRAEVERCMAIGKDCPGFIMAVGNHIPSNTPVESCLYYDQVYRELRDR
jgi:hypothetical protein